MKLREILLNEHLKMSDAGKREWLYNNGLVEDQDVFIDNQGRVTIQCDLDFGFRHFSALPFKLYTVEGDLIFGPNRSFTSLVNMPTDVGGLDISNTGVTSLKGIHKDIKKFTRSGSQKLHLQNCNITELDMGLIFIEDLEGIEYSSGLPKRVETALSIISKHLGKPDNVFDCQQELIEADLEEFAEYEA